MAELDRAPAIYAQPRRNVHWPPFDFPYGCCKLERKPLFVDNLFVMSLEFELENKSMVMGYPCMTASARVRFNSESERRGHTMTLSK